MLKLRIIFSVLLLAVCFGALHYTLPRKTILRIIGTEITRNDFSGWNRVFFSGGDAGSASETVNRDLRLINAIRRNGRSMVLRNEDTAFGWAPYFKFNSSDLQAQAQDLISSAENPKWVMVKQYGWRSRLLSIYPNVVKFKVVDGPARADLPLINRIPYFNIAFLTLLGLIGLGGLRLWQRFRSNHIDPAVDTLDAAWFELRRKDVSFTQKIKQIFTRRE